MAAKRLVDRRAHRGKVLTLRMSESEMLAFKLSAIALGKKRSRIVRERVADLIGGVAVPPTVRGGGNPDGTVAGGTVADGTVAGGG